MKIHSRWCEKKKGKKVEKKWEGREKLLKTETVLFIFIRRLSRDKTAATRSFVFSNGRE